MSPEQTRRNKILALIQSGRVTADQGAQLLKALKQEPAAAPQPSQPAVAERSAAQPVETDIAIIGMSGVFPGARNVRELWNNLKQGRDCITEVPADRWDINEYYDPDPNAPGKVNSKWGGFVPEADRFDPLFFNFSPREAETMDPQQRLFLQESYRALEDAGYAPDDLAGTRCGVFAGVIATYFDASLRQAGGTVDGKFLTGTANGFPPARVAYTLNLMGPTLSVDTACSSSLVAIHVACQNIRTGECDIALAGGVSMLPHVDMYMALGTGGMLSPEGRCKPFDDSADGFVPGEGIGVLVLKSLSKAVADKDHIYGVIKGSKIKHNGTTNGITAPSGNSQAQLEAELYEEYGINPETISYVEAGTGTKLGDSIEVSALTRSFRRYTQQKQYCAMGSTKSNIGHLMAASGVAGVIKILLCMKYKMLVPTIHLKTENQHLNLKVSPFYVNTQLKEWGAPSGVRRAAISSTGVSGTNCHLVIEERP